MIQCRIWPKSRNHRSPHKLHLRNLRKHRANCSTFLRIRSKGRLRSILIREKDRTRGDRKSDHSDQIRDIRSYGLATMAEQKEKSFWIFPLSTYVVLATIRHQRHANARAFVGHQTPIRGQYRLKTRPIGLSDPYIASPVPVIGQWGSGSAPSPNACCIPSIGIGKFC